MGCERIICVLKVFCGVCAILEGKHIYPCVGKSAKYWSKNSCRTSSRLGAPERSLKFVKQCLHCSNTQMQEQIEGGIQDEFERKYFGSIVLRYIVLCWCMLILLRDKNIFLGYKRYFGLGTEKALLFGMKSAWWISCSVKPGFTCEVAQGPMSEGLKRSPELAKRHQT